MFKVVISKKEDGYVGYPIGLDGVVVGDGRTYEEALANTKSAIRLHIQTFGTKTIKSAHFPTEAFIAEVAIS